jgi:surfeit locus 1 family protein
MQPENLICNFKMNFKNKYFRPSIKATLITLALAIICIRLGSWQLNKAESKQALQAQYNNYERDPAEALPTNFSNLEEIRYKKVRVSGKYLPQYQILLDNQFDGERPGYFVITPLEIAGSENIILVNRGWIQALKNHNQIPEVNTPSSLQSVEGFIWVPSQKFFTLEKKTNSKEWNKIWQNMDLNLYTQLVPKKILPVLLKMSPDNEGGFARHWVRPDDRIQTHLSYGYQWYGFAIASFLIYLYLSFKKINKTKVSSKRKAS